MARTDLVGTMYLFGSVPVSKGKLRRRISGLILIKKKEKVMIVLVVNVQVLITESTNMSSAKPNQESVSIRVYTRQQIYGDWLKSKDTNNFM